MSSPEMTDDDESFERPRRFTRPGKPPEPAEPIAVSSDDSQKTIEYISSDEDSNLPSVDLQTKRDQRDKVIKNLFPGSKLKDRGQSKFEKIPSASTHASTSTCEPLKPVEEPGHIRMIGGVRVNFPVPPYGAQIALMAKVIEGINKRVNCLLESPTGSGKTLALLCGALAWQTTERNRIADFEAQQCVAQHPELGEVAGAAATIASPPGSAGASPEKLFSKYAFGEKSIYDKPGSQNGSGDSSPRCKRLEPQRDSSTESPERGLVSLHKRRRIGEPSGSATPGAPATPAKGTATPAKGTATPATGTATPATGASTPVKGAAPPDQPGTPKNVNVPTIYYGARTHKQIQQVVKELGRTSYRGQTRMSVLSSRDYSCIRDFDRSLYASKNDMCRECVKKVRVPKMDESRRPESTNCKYYENRKDLNHGALPPAFDLDELVAAGHRLSACPFYGARLMAATANIIFCPYNYLIDPGIRSSLQIDLRDQIVILDEAHNIEDICRDAATFTFSRDQIQGALKELEVVLQYDYSNQDIMADLVILCKALQNWNDWFGHQIPLVQNRPVNNNEAVFTWKADHFVGTLNNHNIGVKNFTDFQNSTEIFCRKLREDPGPLFGVTQSTATVLDGLSTVLGYLFRKECRYMDDFTPALIRTVHSTRFGNEPAAWRSSQFQKTINKEVFSLRLMCMNPAVIFAALKPARCVILSSGTLTPLISLHSELHSDFPLTVSPSHVIAADRVWIGTLTTCPNGQPLECKSQATNQVDIQDAIGEAVLWTSQVTPNGVLCFLPSYRLMNLLQERCIANQKGTAAESQATNQVEIQESIEAVLWTSQVIPNGVLCFKPSYRLMKLLQERWTETGLWRKLGDTKRLFTENRVVKDHNDIMEDYYRSVGEPKGALLFAVYRGKVSEGMDFKDHQARAVITVGIPYPNTFDMMVKEKMAYNDRHARGRQLLSSKEWLRVQAYRALNQAVGRCVRHRGDWGAVLLIDCRFALNYYQEHLSKWVRNFLGSNHHTYESLVNSPNSIESFMQTMTMKEEGEDM